MTVDPQSYRPRVIVFACKTSAPAEVDLKLNSLSKHVRIIRTMCAGRVHPAYVLRAFDKGADGVLITCCASGECQHLSGNDRAEESFDIARNLTDVLGIERTRVGLEWMTKGRDLSQIIEEFVERVSPLGSMPRGSEESSNGMNVVDPLKDYNAYLCYECAKCTAVCPVARIEEGFSPRRFVRGDSLSGNGTSNLDDCIVCSLCDYRCPQEVQISESIAAARAKQHDSEPGSIRPHGAVFQALGSLMSRETLPVCHDSWIPDNARVSEKSDTLLYVGCAPFHDAFFPNLDVKNLDALRGALKILNHLGIEPAVMKDERCCGHDYYWSGDLKLFRKLAEMNRKRIAATGARRIVFTCPECRHTLQELYANAGMKIDAEMKSITEIISENRDRLDLKPLGKSVTFQDPCRLARNLGDTTSARDAIGVLPSAELHEMAHSGAAGICCAGKWESCDAGTKQLQAGRLAEAAETGAELLVTACPKCEIHLKCAMLGVKEPGFEIRDLTTLVADALPENSETDLKKRTVAHELIEENK